MLCTLLGLFRISSNSILAEIQNNYTKKIEEAPRRITQPPKKAN